MLISTPQITSELQARLDELDALRGSLGQESGRPTPWMGTLRRQVRATSVGGSTSIEGYRVPSEDAVALVSGAEPGTEDENRQAVACYARAMDHVGVMAADPAFGWLDRVVLDLHFDACSLQRDKRPGLWRSGPVGITDDGGGLVYEGPDAGDVPALMAEVFDWLENGDPDLHVVVRAAMAHLHVISIHPFPDGNGRIARIVQSLVLAREGLMPAEFGSIEQYLGEHTPAYYAALNAAHGPRYEPGGSDASGWVALCVEAHLSQARQRLAQIEEAGARWTFLEQLVADRNWPQRLVVALEQSLMGGSDRATYGREAEISPATASADFRRLLDGGLIEQKGQGRSTRYKAGERLRADAASAIRTHGTQLI
jgi:DNA-binding transcriptional ArsR family regulator